MVSKKSNWRRIGAATLVATATLAILITACQTGGGRPDRALPRTVTRIAEPEPPAPPEPADVFHTAKLREMDRAIESSIKEEQFPGAVLWVEHDGVPYVQSYGRRAVLPEEEAMTEDTIFDVASLTKVLATAPAIMKLLEQGRIELDQPVSRYVPEFKEAGREQITIRQLLTHTSGLDPGISAYPAWTGYDAGMQLICLEKPVAGAGEVFRYSDSNFILLGEVVRRVAGMSLAEFTRNQIYEPLGMKDTRFLPSTNSIPRIAPTQQVGTNILRGVVHDPVSRYMGGVAGHAGLFSTASDIARFARMMLNRGELDGVRVFDEETVILMTSVQSPDAVHARRGLGWDIDSGYSRPRGHYFPIGSYGHTGFTGTCLWIDPYSKSFWMLLTSRLHPHGNGNVLPVQWTLADLSAQAVKDFDFSAVRGALPPKADKEASQPEQKAAVLNGIDVLVKTQYAALRGKKVGLITNHTGRDRRGYTTIDLLHEAPEVELVALFSPEHGIRGALDARVDDGKDEKTGLPIYSLYGDRRKPAPEQLEGLDALVFDIQDIGCRFYTYISTMGNCIAAAGEADIGFYVLDRINIINGSQVDGPVLMGEADFVGWHDIAVRHGMTVGELARMFNAEKKLKTRLLVIPVEGWKRDLWMDQCGFPWIDTSPNMRSLVQASLYPGVGLLETTHLSVGRGTDTPFELFGAPYIDADKLAEEMNAFGIRGVRFDPIEFTPNASKFKDQKCGGVRITLTDRNYCNVANIGIAGALVLHRLYPESFGLTLFNRLLKHPPTVEAIREGKTLPEIRKLWEADQEEFMARRQQFLIYQ